MGSRSVKDGFRDPCDLLAASIALGDKHWGTVCLPGGLCGGGSVWRSAVYWSKFATSGRSGTQGSQHLGVKLLHLFELGPLLGPKECYNAAEMQPNSAQLAATGTLSVPK